MDNRSGMSSGELMVPEAAEEGLTLEALAAEASLHPDLVRGFVDYGLIESSSGEWPAVRFQVATVERLRVIQRLREDLGINLAGISAVLDLLERLEDVRRELAALRTALRAK